MNPTAKYDSDGNLCELALHFRLLRQEGYYVHVDDHCLFIYITYDQESLVETVNLVNINERKISKAKVLLSSGTINHSCESTNV